jgi:Lon protease-like protein
MLPDGRYALAVVGVSRFRVERWLPDDPYPRAEIVDLVEPPVPAELRAMVDPVVAALLEVHELSGRVQGVATSGALDLSPEPEQASFEVAELASLGPLDAQAVLELPDTAARLRALHGLLSDGAAVLRARLGETGESGAP